MRKKTATQETGGLRRFHDLDPLDLELIGELELDARQSYSQLAKKLGISRPTVSHKVHRLMDTGVVRVMCLADHLSLGFTIGVALGISVSPSEALNTANKLAHKKPVQQVFLCAGRFDIIAWALFREPEHLLHFLSTDIGELPGALRVESMVTLSMVKFSPAMVTARRGWHPRRPGHRS